MKEMVCLIWSPTTSLRQVTSLRQYWLLIQTEHFGRHITVFTENDSTTAMDIETNGDSDKEDISAPVKRRRKMVLSDDEDDED